jgi:1-acyl-sn-glycerol-3-phosphate acyltransferase
MRLKLSFATFVPAFYWWATHSLRGVLWVLARWEVSGRERVPMAGPLIVVSNHLNNVDPPLLASGAGGRRIVLMGKVEIFKYPFGIVPRLFGAFPVRRFDADVGAMLHAERILRHGGVLGMFPEGTRSRTGHLGKLQPGTALIALRTGATVLPCAITGTEVLRNPLAVLRKPKITFTVGEPIPVEAVRRPTEEQVHELMARITAAIERLLPPKYRATYTEIEAAGTGDDGGDPPGH